jgi:hypothetical protein
MDKIAHGYLIWPNLNFSLPIFIKIPDGNWKFPE